jgi:hypothetical protein
MPHEQEPATGPSDRSFGLTFGAIFLVIGLLPLWRGAGPRWWAVTVAALFWGMAFWWPRGLAPANRIWLRIGLLMHRVVNPVVMAAVFYAAVTPFGLVSRMFRAGLARRLRPDRDMSSYWIARGGPRSRMDQQF